MAFCKPFAALEIFSERPRVRRTNPGTSRETVSSLLSLQQGLSMAKKVILYFENERDALRFTLAAGSAMADAGQPNTAPNAMLLAQRLSRATRIRVRHTPSQDDDEPQPVAKAG